jgi:hypothetical protein
MKFLVLIATILSFNAAQAGDKIGNAGGLWVCSSPAQGMIKGMLVDLYEARTEFGLILIQSNETNPVNIVKERENYLRQNSSRYLRDWSSALAEVFQKMRLVDAELEKIDDALFRMRPLPSTCAGTWEYVQFANFTHQNQVLIRQDMWNSPLIPTLDKAALIWHEAIYKWLRETQGDKDSVRARQIVGLIFAQISPRELEEGVAAVLKQTGPTPSPGPAPVPAPTNTSVCFMSNRMNQLWYMAYAPTEASAKVETLKTCQQAPDGFHCADESLQCDSFRTDAPSTFIATITNRSTGQKYPADGRSQREANGKAMVACTTAAGPHTAVHCAENYY